MKRENTAIRLNRIMKERNLKQADILRLAKPYCEKYGIKLGRNDLSQYVSGKVEPGQYKLTALAHALNVSEVWLMGYDEDMPQNDLSKYGIRPITRKTFPMLGEIACGKPIMCNEDYETFIETSADIKADFCLTAKGDSMINARIFDGDIVFIRSQQIVDDGEIAAVIINDEATLKRVYIKSDRIILRPENPLYDDFVYEKEYMNDVRIIGKAVAFQSIVR